MVSKCAFTWVKPLPSAEAHPTEAMTTQVAAQLDVLLEARKPNLTLAVVAALAGGEKRGNSLSRDPFSGLTHVTASVVKILVMTSECVYYEYHYSEPRCILALFSC